jgi:LPS sulfotransferase NodH
VQVTCSYLVCATPRSGSTLLCEALTNTGLAGQPAEYFEALKTSGLPRRPSEYFTHLNDSELTALLQDYTQADDPSSVSTPHIHTDYERYLADVLEKGTTPNGVFGAKVMWGYLDDFVSHLHEITRYRNIPAPEIFTHIFPHLHYITITRQDKIRQAISLWKAIQTQVWREEVIPANQQRPPIKLTFHFAAIDHLIQQIIDHEAAWQNFFAEHNIQPFAVVYEDLAQSYEATACDILRYLRIPIPENFTLIEPQMKQQADALSEEWVQRYVETKQAQEQQSA